jgi:hypothetical protein
VSEKEEGDEAAQQRAAHLVARWIMGVVGAAALVQSACGIGTGRLTYSVGEFSDDTRVLTAPGELAQGIVCFAVLGGLLFGYAMWPERFHHRPRIIVASLVAFLLALGWLGRLGL